MRDGFTFTVAKQDGNARASVFTTPNATVQTPAFMPVGTQASVKSLTPREVEATSARLILGNTYHLWIRPGAEVVQKLGGIRGFMKWPHAVLTDSGGYQVFSLAKLRTIDDDGVTFRSHLDGALLRLTPEESMRIQAALGSDVAMAFDECPAGAAPRNVIEAAMRRTTSWAKRCIEFPTPPSQARFGIVQGGTNDVLRKSHLEDICALAFDGFALGGFSVGEPIPDMHRALHEIAPRMPSATPRYLMGVGTPFDLLVGVQAGIDLFDCVLPTRNARNGQALTWSGRVNLRQARHKEDDAPLDARCTCETCVTYSRGYLRHLFVAKEMLGPRLVTQHNLSFYAALMTAARNAILEQRLETFVKEALHRMREGDEVGTG